MILPPPSPPSPSSWPPASADDADGRADADAGEPATRVVTAGRRAEWSAVAGQPGGVVSPPVWRASTILYDDVAHLRAAAGDSHERLFYGRRGTPTQWSLADAITGLEPQAAGTMLYPSGWPPSPAR